MLVMTNVGRLVLLLIIDNKVEILTINGDVENQILRLNRLDISFFILNLVFNS